MQSQPITFTRIKAVCEATGRSRSTVYADVQRGLFTRPVKLGERAVAWPKHEVEAVNRAKLAGASPDKLRALVESLHHARTATTGSDAA